MTRMRTGVSGVFLALMIALAVAGCGSTQTPTTPTPTPTASQGGLSARLGDLTAYLEQVQPITSELGATVASLPDAVKGLSAKPDGTWTTSATKLSDIAAQLGNEASSLAALTPPDGLQPLQEAAVKGIQGAQSAVNKIAEALDKRATTSATRQSRVQSEISKLQEQLSSLSKMLSGGIEALLGSSNSTPSP